MQTKIYNKKISIALFNPEIPQNTGNIIRTCAVFGLRLFIIHPCSFIWDNKLLTRSAMDYLHKVEIIHLDNFQQLLQHGNIIAASCNAKQSCYSHTFQENDIILFGKESVGLPLSIENMCSQQIIIPMEENVRSLNLSVSVSMIIAISLGKLNF